MEGQYAVVLLFTGHIRSAIFSKCLFAVKIQRIGTILMFVQRFKDIFFNKVLNFQRFGRYKESPNTSQIFDTTN
jgi:hypothetical protein